MKVELELQNLKCSGCGNTITKALSKIEGTSKIEVSPENSMVTLEIVDEMTLTEVKTKLASIGYPDSNSGNSLGKKAKSVVSCTLGRL